LVANRAHHLTDRQKQRLLAEERSAKRVRFGVSIFLLGLSVLPLISIIVANRPENLGEWLLLIPWLGWLFIWGGLGYVMARRSFEPRQYHLAALEGPITVIKVVSRSSKSTSAHYELPVGNKKFRIESDIVGSLWQGEVYAIYDLSDVNEILSLERLASVS
jgi:hypothetical protein